MLIALVAWTVYWNSLRSPFLFDDEESIVYNVYIRSLTPISQLFKAPRQTTVDGRPVVSLTLALNYAIGELDVRIYRATNVIIHLLAGLTLFGLVRQTLRSEALQARYRQRATGLALAAALIWTAHPLCTQAVTYVVQRAESLMALLYLLTLYCAVRGIGTTRPRGWYAASIAACLLAMGTKEVAVTAPLVVLLCDRTFFSHSLVDALRRRPIFYLLLSLTVLVQVALFASTPRPDVEGFGVGRQQPFMYLLTQFGVILRYLRLAFWPAGLCLDYDWPVATGVGDVFVPMLIVVALLVASIIGLARRSGMGFLGAAFFLILAPTSSVLPLFDPIFEHRMYLPLAVVCVATVVAVWSGVDRLLQDRSPQRSAGHVVLVGALAVVVFVLGMRTIDRNRDYQSALAMWTDVVAKRPESIRAQVNLGISLLREGYVEEAVTVLEEAVERRPDYAEGQNNYAAALVKAGRLEEAVPHFEASLRLSDKYPAAHSNLGFVLESLGRIDEAIEQYNQAIGLDPDYQMAHENLAYLLGLKGRNEEAIAHYRAALQIPPERATTHNNLGNLLSRGGQLAEAVPHFEAALRIAPELTEARNNLGITLARLGRVEEAVAHFEAVLDRQPENVSVMVNLFTALRRQGRQKEAAARLLEAIRLRQFDVDLQRSLAKMLMRDGDFAEAAAAYRIIQEQSPANRALRIELIEALIAAGKKDEAVAEAESLLAEHPNDTRAAELLRRLQSSAPPASDGP